MADLKTIAQREGYVYAIAEDKSDTDNVICRRGHIYQDGKSFVAAIDGATLGESAKLRKLGQVIMDGDFGELSVKFPPSRMREITKVLKPRQAVLVA